MAAAPAVLAMALAQRPAAHLALAFAAICLGYHLLYRAVRCHSAMHPATPADA